MPDSSFLIPVAGVVAELLVNGRALLRGRIPAGASFEPGSPGSRVIVVAGSNAAGTKLGARLVARLLEVERVKRRGASPHSERIAETLASDAILKHSRGVSTAQMVSVRMLREAAQVSESGAVLSWVMADNCEEGLSDSACDAEGTRLAQFGSSLPMPQCQGLIVVTESRPLVSAMLFSLPLLPHFLCFSPRRSADLVQDWLDEPDLCGVPLPGGVTQRGQAGRAVALQD